MTIQILSNPIKKGLLLTAIQIRGTAETRRCGADAVRLQVITKNSPLTLRASYLPLPPPPAPPLVLRVVLIATLVNLAHGSQGCPKIISFDKNYWHLSFRLTLFNLLSLYRFIPAHFSQHPLPEKLHLLFSANHQSGNPFSRFLLCSEFLLSLNKHANYSYRRI